MKTENKNVVRLSESQLKQIVAEELNKALNEIGNTPFGQYMLGRTAARQKKYPGANYVNASDYAANKRREYDLGSYDFQNGHENQNDLQYWLDAYEKDGDDYQASKLKQEKYYINRDMHDLAYANLPYYKKKVDDENRAKSNNLRQQMRKKYSLNNPVFNETNESKLNSKIDKIVSESIDRILKNK